MAGEHLVSNIKMPLLDLNFLSPNSNILEPKIYIEKKRVESIICTVLKYNVTANDVLLPLSYTYMFRPIIEV